MDMFSFTRFCLRVLADLNEIIRRMKRKVILTIAINSNCLSAANLKIAQFSYSMVILIPPEHNSTGN